jgi:hypothetical protein
MRPFPLLFVSAWALLACGGPTMAPYSPGQRDSSASGQALFEAAEGTLLDHGYLIGDKEAGKKLVTKERTLLGGPVEQDEFKYTFTVEVGGGKVKMSLGCTVGTKGGDFVPCGEDAPEKLIREQSQMLDQITREAEGG